MTLSVINPKPAYLIHPWTDWRYDCGEILAEPCELDGYPFVKVMPAIHVEVVNPWVDGRWLGLCLFGAN